MIQSAFALTGTVLVFVISLLIGALCVHVGALVIADANDAGDAVLVALLGALVWGLAGRIVGPIPVVGPLLTSLVALVAYVAIVKWRYGASWLEAAAIALLAWVVALGVLTVLGRLGLGSLGAVGVPRLPPGLFRAIG